jgi:hypothetical protein
MHIILLEDCSRLASTKNPILFWNRKFLYIVHKTVTGLCPEQSHKAELNSTFYVQQKTTYNFRCVMVRVRVFMPKNMWNMTISLSVCDYIIRCVLSILLGVFYYVLFNFMCA